MILAAFFFLPIIILAMLSFGPAQTLGWPSFTSMSLANYLYIFRTPFYISAIVRTISLALEITLVSLVIGYPTAFIISKSKYREVVTVLLIVPMFVSILVLQYGWMIILGSNGVLNNLLIDSGLIKSPLRILFTYNGEVVGGIHFVLPYVILALLTVLANIDETVVEASQNLGASGWRTFVSVIFPLSSPGIIAAVSISLSLSTSLFVVPALLGGDANQVLSTAIYQAAGFSQWGIASATAVVTSLINMGIVVVFFLFALRLSKHMGIRS